MDKQDWMGFLTLMKKEVLRFWKVKGQTIMSPLVNASLYLLVFGVSLTRMLEGHQGISYLAFLVPGLIALSALNNALQNSASSIIISKFHGDMQDLKVVPISPHLIGIAYAMACLIRGFCVGFFVWLLGEVFHQFMFGKWIGVAHPLMLIGFMAMGCVLFGNLGIWVGFLAKSFDQVNAFTSFVILPLIYLGGVFFSIDVLHPLWQTAAKLNPLLYIISGIRWSLLGVADISWGTSALVAASFVLISSALAWYSVRYGSYQRF